MLGFCCISQASSDRRLVAPGPGGAPPTSKWSGRSARYPLTTAWVSATSRSLSSMSSLRPAAQEAARLQACDPSLGWLCRRSRRRRMVRCRRGHSSAEAGGALTPAAAAAGRAGGGGAVRHGPRDRPQALHGRQRQRDAGAAPLPAPPPTHSQKTLQGGSHLASVADARAGQILSFQNK